MKFGAICALAPTLYQKLLQLFSVTTHKLSTLANSLPPFVRKTFDVSRDLVRMAKNETDKLFSASAKESSMQIRWVFTDSDSVFDIPNVFWNSAVRYMHFKLKFNILCLIILDNFVFIWYLNGTNSTKQSDNVSRYCSQYLITG